MVFAGLWLFYVVANQVRVLVGSAGLLTLLSGGEAASVSPIVPDRIRIILRDGTSPTGAISSGFARINNGQNAIFGGQTDQGKSVARGLIIPDQVRASGI
jgi:hypothetical protein